MLRLEYFVTPQELLAKVLSLFITPYLALIMYSPLLILLVLWVYSKIYGKQYPIKAAIYIVLIGQVVVFLASIISFLPDIYASPRGIGVEIKGGNMTLYLGVWGTYAVNLSQCQIEWRQELQNVVRVSGTGLPGLVYGNLRVDGIAAKGILVDGAEYFMIAKCPHGNFVVGVPGLRPQDGP